MKTLLLVLLLIAPTFGQQPDAETFWRIYDTQSIAGKKLIWRALSKPEQVDVRRLNFEWGIIYLYLDDTQIDFLGRLSTKLPTITRQQAHEFEAEANKLFSYRQAALLFGSIGPYRPCNFLLVKLPTQRTLQPQCYCSIGSSFNMSCDTDCRTGFCLSSEDGCGFMWLYSCNGICPG